MSIVSSGGLQDSGIQVWSWLGPPESRHGSLVTRLRLRRLMAEGKHLGAQMNASPDERAAGLHLCTCAPMTGHRRRELEFNLRLFLFWVSVAVCTSHMSAL